ncbi:Uncharacterised protein [Slackia heliotrinireducens]|uniref:Uncharacterized protein n=1 Tax=Slackia heliotrinireducens (strain ATCC 29202 / DSM 20476 / NCTC 11029 / RHS 1) TaxID=471855 RepID=C7N4P7_SLAHD|nr:hypothetical protein [Slackia heliotrinireducens]ACV21882.1 hypothetical protein Shel_08260 [Slackia heliotrinireducens DSM 20476]VEG99661.1 Uncharacterised protein [Slackia heliotrinireducens]
MAKTDSFTDIISGDPWDAYNGEVFPLFCPLTTRNCHSKCACFKERRTTTAFRGTDEDVAYREDGYTFGTCTVFDFDIGAYRD